MFYFHNLWQEFNVCLNVSDLFKVFCSYKCTIDVILSVRFSVIFFYLFILAVYISYFLIYLRSISTKSQRGPIIFVRFEFFCVGAVVTRCQVKLNKILLKFNLTGPILVLASGIYCIILISLRGKLI